MNTVKTKVAVVAIISHLSQDWVQVEDLEDFQEEHLDIELSRPMLLWALRELVVSLALQFRIKDEIPEYALRIKN
jgi:hypothetical protein